MLESELFAVNTGVRNHVNGLALLRALNGEFNVAINLGEQGVILALANVFTSVEAGAALTHDDGTSRNQFAAVNLNAQAFGFGVTTVAGATACFFVCHDCLSLLRNRVDADFGEVLTMTLVFLVVLTTTHLEDADLVATTVGNNGGLNSGAGNHRGAYNNLFTVSNHQHFFKYDLAVDVCRYLFYFEFFTNDNLVLLAAGFYDRIHSHELLI
ncbi:hypothetical protein AWB61_19835 [Chromobacterium sp. F49]|nr:hypothetical protein Cv017_00195 [Chromobacterium subtsugae]KZE85494.1 hypothetical protein AWB61_19835 [Chromobacterium sp. F49]OBU87038.1 hypothetical protein MY55_05855 [Chromobacterium subtsugae]